MEQLQAGCQSTYTVLAAGAPISWRCAASKLALGSQGLARACRTSADTVVRFIRRKHRPAPLLRPRGHRYIVIMQFLRTTHRAIQQGEQG